MSGLLRRLARYAFSGTTPVLHSMARMRYVAPPLRSEVGAAAALEDVPALSLQDLIPDVRPPVAPDERCASPGTGTNNVRQFREFRPPQRVVVDEASPTTAFASRGLNQGREELEIPYPLRKDWVPEEIVPRLERGVPTTIEPRDSVVSEEPPKRTRFLAVEATPTKKAVVGQRPTSPSSVFAVEPRPVRGRSGRIATRAGPLPLPDDREPTEVHVHIGRIEVTAIREPAPAKRDRQPDRKPLSLDEYLDKRRRRSS